MSVNPNTTIKILSGIPFDFEYKHTLYFGSAAAQTEYMTSKIKYTLTAQSYQRINSNKMRVEKSADDLRDCNYLWIQNISHSSRDYFAFIVNVEYVNEQTAEIEYKVDILQSYLFAYDNGTSLVNVGSSFIEREHSATDNIGDNLVPENVALGEYVFNGYAPLIDMTQLHCLIAIAEVGEGKTVDGHLYNGIYGGATLYAFPANSTSDLADINDFLDDYIEDPNAIVSMYVVPSIFVNASGAIGADHKLNSQVAPYQTDLNPSALTGTETFEGYSPKNKKLYTYPYNYLHVDNGSGDSLSLRYEYFSVAPKLLMFGAVTEPVKVRLMPTNYKGMIDTYGAEPYAGYHKGLNTEFIELSNYPLCSWNYDSFKNWLAQNSVPLLLNTAGSIATGAISASFSAHPGAMAGATAISTITNLLSQFYTASIKADVCCGKQTNSGASTTFHVQQFFGARCCITGKYAEVIDNYFSTYGYATNKVKTPNVFNSTGRRPYWNYCKTIGANVYGKASASVLKEIGDIFDKGITFWMQGAYYGDYSKNNAV